MRTFTLLASLGMAAAWHPGTSSEDLRRAFQKRPYKDSHVASPTMEGTFEKMNLHLKGSGVSTLPCEMWPHKLLNELAHTLYAERDVALDKIYRLRSDKRAHHFDDMDYKESLWAKEALDNDVDSESYNVTRGGKCAELVMWWVHHLPRSARRALSARSDFRLPLLPLGGPKPDGDLHSSEYVYQVQCISCHLSMPCERFATNQTKGSSIEMLCPEESAIDTPKDHPLPKERPVGQPPHECPVDNTTGKPKVWYNRTKRCEWDFDPPCGVCEGLGGMVWGDGEHQWQPPKCRLHTAAEDIPVGNLTNPVWPKAFTAVEYSCGNTRGLDACAPHNWNKNKGHHNHYTHYYDQIDMSEFPVPENWPLTGKQPVQHTHFVSSVPGLGNDQWTYPNGNMYSKSGPVCVCFSDPNKQPRQPGSKDPHPTPDPFPSFKNVLLGPLKWDFPHDSILIGREEIELEWTGKDGKSKTVIADHWNKGPHHFWYDVQTNLMVRQWQAEAALTLQTEWQIGPPAREDLEVPKGCYSGIQAQNLSCVAPAPAPHSLDRVVV